MNGKCNQFQNRDAVTLCCMIERSVRNIRYNEWKGNAILFRTEMQWHYVVWEKEVYLTSDTMNEREMLSLFKAAMHSHILLWETEKSNIWWKCTNISEQKDSDRMSIACLSWIKSLYLKKLNIKGNINFKYSIYFI